MYRRDHLEVSTGLSSPPWLAFRAAARLLSAEPTRLQAAAVVLVGILAFTALPMWQTLRQPRIGDADILRIGLVILNRYAAEDFPRDMAMQAGAWWAGYTPLYVQLIGAGYLLVRDLGIVFALVTWIAYGALLSGFYRLGRALGLPFGVSLLLMCLSGLYIVASHALAWTGVANEMAAPRNLYLGLFPWIIYGGLRIWRRSARPARDWLLFGGLLGLSALLHPISAGVVASALALMLAIGCGIGRLHWRGGAAFVIGALPGLLAGYQLVEAHVGGYAGPGEEAARAAADFMYFSIARVNVFFFRLQGWPPALLAYTLLTLLTGAYLLVSRRPEARRSQWVWASFGLAQFAALLLVFLVDWWILLVAVEWARQIYAGRETAEEHMTLVFIACVLLLALSASSVLSLLAQAQWLPAGASLARMFQRGGTFSFAGLIVLTAFLFRQRWQAYPGRWLYLAAAVATFTIGLHQREFEQIPGFWLPFDHWIYPGVAVSIAWPHLHRRRLLWLRDGALAMLAVIAVTRSLAMSDPQRLRAASSRARARPPPAPGHSSGRPWRSTRAADGWHTSP